MSRECRIRNFTAHFTRRSEWHRRCAPEPKVLKTHGELRLRRRSAPREVGNGAILDRSPFPGIVTAGVAKRGVRAAPRLAVVRIIEFDKDHLVRTHVREVPPAMFGRVVKNGSRRHILLAFD